MKIPHAAGPLSPCATTAAVCATESLCSATREATTMRSPCTTTKSSPCSLPLKKSPHSNEDPAKQKKKKKKKRGA